MGKAARRKREAKLQDRQSPTKLASQLASPVTPPGYIIRLLDRSDAAELAAANDLVNAVGLASSPNPIGPKEFPRQLQAILLGLGTPHLPRRTIMFDVVAIDESTGDVGGVAHSRQQAEMFHRLQAAGLPWDNIADTVSFIKLAVAPRPSASTTRCRVGTGDAGTSTAKRISVCRGLRGWKRSRAPKFLC